MLCSARTKEDGGSRGVKLCMGWDGIEWNGIEFTGRQSGGARARARETRWPVGRLARPPATGRHFVGHSACVPACRRAVRAVYVAVARYTPAGRLGAVESRLSFATTVLLAQRSATVVVGRRPMDMGEGNAIAVACESGGLQPWHAWRRAATPQQQQEVFLRNKQHRRCAAAWATRKGGLVIGLRVS